VYKRQVNTDELVKRLLNRALETGRTDDTEAVIKNRLEVYLKHTEPLLDFYRKHGLLWEVAGEGDVDAIFSALCDVIDTKY
jgi:adenylate kinase